MPGHAPRRRLRRGAGPLSRGLRGPTGWVALAGRARLSGGLRPPGTNRVEARGALAGIALRPRPGSDVVANATTRPPTAPEERRRPRFRGAPGGRGRRDLRTALGRCHGETMGATVVDQDMIGRVGRVTGLIGP